VQRYGFLAQPGHGLPTPPFSRSSPTTTTQSTLGRQRSKTSIEVRTSSNDMRGRRNSPASSMPNTALHVSPAATMSALMTKMHTRPKRNPSNSPASAHILGRDGAHSMHAFSSQAKQDSPHSPLERNAMHMRSKSTTGNLRSFRLQASAMAGGMTRRTAVPQG
jgi:hypothetical protein